MKLWFQAFAIGTLGAAAVFGLSAAIVAAPEWAAIAGAVTLAVGVLSWLAHDFLTFRGGW